MHKATLKYEIDYSCYVDKITVKKIDAYEVSSDTTYLNDGTYAFEVTDSLTITYDCKLAIPNKSDTDYKIFYKLLSTKLASNNLSIFAKNQASLEFQISRTGEMTVESIDGFQSNAENWLISYLESWKWEPSDLFDKKVDTKHKMLILLK